MARPRLATVDGAYWYLLGTILATALLAAAYLGLVAVAAAPPPEDLVGLLARAPS